ICELVIEELQNGVINPEDVLILAPRRRVGYRIRNQLAARDIAVKSYFREAVIKEDKVKYAYSLLNLLANPNDLIALRYLIGDGSSDFRKTQYALIAKIAEDENLQVKDVLDEMVAEARLI